jgi:hypothetical protein
MHLPVLPDVASFFIWYRDFGVYPLAAKCGVRRESVSGQNRPHSEI